MNTLQLLAIAYALLMLMVNSVCGFIAYSLAKKRDLKPFLAFLTAFFGSVAAVFYIAMFPEIVKKEQFPHELDD
jgi:hypothetical protein